MSPIGNIVKRNKVLLGSVGLLVSVHYSWYVMQQDMQTDEVGKTLPWIRVSLPRLCSTLIHSAYLIGIEGSNFC